MAYYQTLFPWRRRATFELILLGLFSGILSAQTVAIVDGIPQLYSLLPTSASVVLSFGIPPGLVFGLVFGVALYLLALLSGARALFFVLLATGSYLLAFALFMEALEHLSAWAAGYVAGLAGGSLLSVWSAVLVGGRALATRLILLSLLGGIFGALCGAMLSLGWGLGVCFSLWQMGFAAAWAILVLEPCL